MGFESLKELSMKSLPPQIACDLNDNYILLKEKMDFYSLEEKKIFDTHGLENPQAPGNYTFQPDKVPVVNKAKLALGVVEVEIAVKIISKTIVVSFLTSKNEGIKPSIFINLPWLFQAPAIAPTSVLKEVKK